VNSRTFICVRRLYTGPKGVALGRRYSYLSRWPVVPALSGCSIVFGNPFDVHPVSLDAGSPSPEVHSAPPALDDCQLSFYVSNHIQYPAQSAGAVELTTETIDTD
jgi:hypothetical protein